MSGVPEHVSSDPGPDGAASLDRELKRDHRANDVRRVPRLRVRRARPRSVSRPFRDRALLASQRAAAERCFLTLGVDVGEPAMVVLPRRDGLP